MKHLLEPAQLNYAIIGIDPESSFGDETGIWVPGVALKKLPDIVLLAQSPDREILRDVREYLNQLPRSYPSVWLSTVVASARSGMIVTFREYPRMEEFVQGLRL